MWAKTHSGMLQVLDVHNNFETHEIVAHRPHPISCIAYPSADTRLPPAPAPAVCVRYLCMLINSCKVVGVALLHACADTDAICMYLQTIVRMPLRQGRPAQHRQNQQVHA